jgi:3-oxoacyl-[acyl-carrier protein] reductase
MNSPQRRALVTGASGDIGAAICRRLAAAGHYVYAHAHRGADAAAALAAELNREARCCEPLSFDVTDPEASRIQLEALVADAPIQILVNNAGVHDDAPFPGMTAAQWHRVIDVSVNGFFNVTRPLTMPMIRSRWGRIVCVSSIAALLGNRGQVNYAAAKGALIAAARSLALELATRGITVNSVAPGIIAGRMSRKAFDADAIRALVPMGRPGSPDEVAAVVAFLASDDAAYITGQTVSVNGGMI